jgi:predicted permease
MNTLLQDFRFGWRMLAKSPGFAAAAILILALGIGANTAIFSLLDAVMLRSLPIHDPSRLVVLRWIAHQSPSFTEMSSFGDCEGGGEENPTGCSFTYPFFERIRSQKDVFSGATAFAGPAQLVLSGIGSARMAQGELVSGDYFSTLGVNAVAGRTLGPDDDTVSSAPAAVLSYGFWQSAFGGDPSAVGRTILLNTVPFTVVGVAEPGFTSFAPGKTQDLFLSLSILPRLNIPWGRDTRSADNSWLVVVARLKPGMAVKNAQAAASLIFRNEMLYEKKPLSKASDEPAIVLAPAQSGLTGARHAFSEPLYVLMFAVAFILLIACANVAGLLLSRASARQKEMAVRLALGAGRARIVRQLLTESVLLSLAGGTLGILFAYWGVYAMTTLILADPGRPFPFVVEPDLRVLVFTIAVSLITGILFGLAPAFRGTQVDLTPALKENASTLPASNIRSGRRFLFGKALVVVQVALSMIVLLGAGLFVRTLQNLRSVNPGFDTRNILLFSIDPTLLKYQDSKIQNLYRNLQEQLASLPGVLSASYSSNALLSGGLWSSSVHIEGQPEKSTQQVDMLATSRDFLRTMRIPLIGGRTFTSEDFKQAAEAAEAQRVDEDPPIPPTPAKGIGSPTAAGPLIPVMVNQAFVREYFADQNPLGKHLTKGNSEETSGELARASPRSKGWEIIGIVGDTKYNNLRREVHPTFYAPVVGGGAYFELRTAANPAALIPAVRKAVNRADGNLPLIEIQTQSDKIDELLVEERVVARLSSFFGLLALLLACIGLYGLLSYEVSRRTREIGIRMALGAERHDVTRLIIVRGIRLTLVGVAAGVAGGLAVTRVLSSLLYGVKPADLTTYLAVTMLLSAVALMASYLPARRATKVDPMVALRYE